MKKCIILSLVLALAAFSASAAAADDQNSASSKKKGITFGVDNDEKDYLIASPSRNWYLSGGIGVQTFIGNETESSGRWNCPTPAIHLEIGKWILPDIAVSFNFAGLNSYSQSKGEGTHPWIDPSQEPRNGYWTSKFWNMAFDGLVTLDWTSLCRGFEVGNKRRVHIHTPIGLGLSLACHDVTNAIYRETKSAKAAPNCELNFTVGLNVDIRITRHCSIYPGLRFMFSRGTLDYAPNDKNVYTSDAYGSSRLDYMPSVFCGFRYGFFKHEKKSRVSQSDAKSAQKAAETVIVNNPSKLAFDGGAYFETTEEQKQTIKVLTAERDSLHEKKEVLEKEIKVAKTQIDNMGGQLKNLQSIRRLTPMEEALLSQLEEHLACTRVYFQIGQSLLDVNARIALDEFANIIKKSDKSAVYYIIGAADKATGSVTGNTALSKNRCDVIYNYLVKNCGIPASKLAKKPIGGIDEYGTNELNRMGLVVLSSSTMTKILNKYSK